MFNLGKCGSQFLWELEHTWPVEKDVQMFSDTDVEVKCSLKVSLVSSSVNMNALEKTSSWKNIKRITAVIMKCNQALLYLAKKWQANADGPIADINLLQKCETAVIKLHQRRAFHKEISTLENRRAISGQSNIFKLDPSLDNDGVLKVVGIIIKANLDYFLPT